MKQCSVCGKRARQSRNRSHSQRQTIRTVYPNLQMQDGDLICAKCKRNQNRS